MYRRRAACRPAESICTARESCAVSLGPVLIRNSCEPIGAKCLGGNSAEPEPERDTARTIPFAFSYHGLSLALLWLLGMKAAHPHHAKSKPKTFLLYNPFMSHRNQPEKLPCVYFGRGTAGWKFEFTQASFPYNVRNGGGKKMKSFARRRLARKKSVNCSDWARFPAARPLRG